MKALLIFSLTFNFIQFGFALWMNDFWYKKMGELNKSWLEKSVKIVKQLSDSGEEQNEN